MNGVALFAGDVSLDLTMSVSHVPGPDEKVRVDALYEAPGGVVSNAAVAARLAGASVRLLACTGSDLASRTVPGLLRARGVEIDFAERPGALCRAVIVVDRAGEKRLLLHPGSSMYPSLEQVSGVSLTGVRWLHTAIYEREEAGLLIERCRQAGIPFSIDLEPVTFGDGIDGLAHHVAGAAVVFCNTRAAERLAPDAAEQATARLERLGVRSVVMTQGPSGATWHGGGRAVAIAAPKIVAADTTGAGDCLAGWFVAGTLAGAAPAEALRMAVIAASWSCARFGAQASFPGRADIDCLSARGTTS
jgi:ribokinase